MVSTVAINQPPPSYPCLMTSGDIVIMALREANGELVGVCLNSFNGEEEIGNYSVSWVKNKFRPFNGSVTITN